MISIAFGVSSLLNSAPAVAAQTVPYKINFQGRLTDNSGNILTDGLYNVKFRLWTALSGGSNSWEADRVRGTSDNRIQVTNGLFNIQFGDTALGDPAITTALFSNGTYPLYLEVELPTPATASCATNGCAVFTEGAMTPRQALASSPYAVNSDTLDGLDSSAFAQTGTSNTFTSAQTVQASSTTAVVVQSGSNAATLTVDTTGHHLILGKPGASGINTDLVFNNATNANQVSIKVADGTNAYALTLPTAVGNTNDCLKATNGTGTLGFGSCSSLQSAYDASGTGQPKILLSSTLGGLSIQDGTTPVTGNIFAIQNNGATATYLGVTSSAVTFQDSAGNSAMTFDSTTSHLKIYENITSPVRYADVYYDNVNSEAVFAASSGITHIGNGSGNVTIPLTGQNDIFTFSKTYTPGASYVNNDFTISRALTAGGNTAGGSVVKIEDVSSGTVIQPTILLLNENNAAATGSLIKGQLNGADKFTVGVAGSVTIAAGQSYTGAGAVTVAPAAATALTLTSNASATWSTSGAGQLTLQSGSGTLSFGSTANLTAGGALTLDSGTTSALGIGTGANAKAVTIGNNTGATSVSISSGTGGINIGDDATTKTINIGGNTNSGTDTINIATNATAADSITIGNTNAATEITLVAGPSTTTSGTAGVVIGSATADATQINLQLDSASSFAEAASTCSTTVNQGSLYYNSSSNVIRGCVNGAWEDMVSTAGLGLQLFGVVPDTGAAPGDLAAVTGTNIAGPCKVAVGANTTTVSWTGCTAYSGGRKVIVAAGTAATSATGSAGTFQHLCLTGTNNQPVLSARGTEILNLATVSMPSVTAPILCLADIKLPTNNNATIGVVYDTRTYTTTLKETVSIGTTAPALGHLVQQIATRGTVIPMATLNGNAIAGVVVATTGATSTTTINGIIAVSGPAAVKSITSTSNAVGAYILGTATAGYAGGNTAKPTEATTTIYNVLGVAQTAWTGATTCVINSDACAGSVLTIIDKR